MVNLELPQVHFFLSDEDVFPLSAKKKNLSPLRAIYAIRSLFSNKYISHDSSVGRRKEIRRGDCATSENLLREKRKPVTNES